MRTILENHINQLIYLFTTQGHIHAGLLSQVLEDVLDLIAPDGTTHIYVNLADVSGVRAYDVEPEAAT
jgi:hypothetical protein